MNRSLARLVAAGMVACSMLGGASVAHTATAALKTYTDKAHHISFQYPATWKLKHASLDSTDKSIGITYSVAVLSPDLLVGYAIAIKPSASTTGKMKAAATAAMRDFPTVVGKISYDTRHGANGQPIIVATASVKLDATRTADAAVAVVSLGKQTYYLADLVMTKPAATNSDVQELKAVADSVGLS